MLLHPLKNDSIKSNVNESLRSFVGYPTLVCRVKTKENAQTQARNIKKLKTYNLMMVNFDK